MAEQKEFNSEKIITWGLGLSTILYIGGIGYLFGYDVWVLTQKGRMGEAGDFIAGFTTPVVFLWLIYGYFLQRRELGLQRKELQQTRNTLDEQVEMAHRQAEAGERQAEAIERQGREARAGFRRIGGD